MSPEPYFAGTSILRRPPPITAVPVAAELFRRRMARSTVVVKSMAVQKWRNVRGVKKMKVVDDDNGGERKSKSVKDYFEETKVMMESNGGNGPPRWFSPLESGSRMENSPLLLYLPGIDGIGLGLILQHQKLGKIFDIWCLHIPVKDRTPFQELVDLVEETIRSENQCSPDRPIYVVGETIGGCLALAVAARNPAIDLVLILANPATSYKETQMQSLFASLRVIPSELSLISLPSTLNLLTGELLKMVLSTVEKGLEHRYKLEHLLYGLEELSSYLSVLVDMFPRDTLLWKLQMIKSAGSFVHASIHAVKAQILILASGKDPLLPNLEEAKKIRGALPKQTIRALEDTGEMPKCEIRKFDESGHFLFLENGVDLVTIIKGASFYRQGKVHDYVFDYMPPTESEVKKLFDTFRLIDAAIGAVMLSTLGNGKIVNGLAGIPDEGPVVLVGYHMLLGVEVYSLALHFTTQKNIILRGLAHPMIFMKLQEDDQVDRSMFDGFRIMGAVPVSASNFYKLLASRSHVLLYPGGMREALHKKGEEYQLLWPERSEFVRMAARFGAKIIPFGAVGEDDICELVADYEDQAKIPFLKERMDKAAANAIRVRPDSGDTIINQVGYVPGVVPKPPGRFYYLFGKPIDTAEMKQEIRNSDKAHELYMHVKSEVGRCLTYLKERREKDPYRSLFARTLYRAQHGWTSEVPTFEL